MGENALARPALRAMATIHDITCPFCSLLCDDLSLKAVQGALRPQGNNCRLAAQGFAAPPPPLEANIRGAPAPVEQAVGAAAAILRRSKKPLIAGLGTDIHGIRAALRLAEATGALLQHKQQRPASHNLKVMQARGWIMTTLAEVKNRADVVVFVGDGVTRKHPRFIERCLNAPYSMFLGKNGTRKLAYLGRPAREEMWQLSPAPVVISRRDSRRNPTGIADNLALLRARLKGERRLGRERLSAAAERKLDLVASMLKEANYAVLVWSPSALPEQHADLIIESLSDLLRDLNQTRRAAGLALSGNEGGAAFQSVAAWQTGLPPLNIDFAGGYPSIDVADESRASCDADSLVWISTFAADKPPASDSPIIALSPYPAAGANADVYLPVGTPGLDHGGVLTRTDSVVSLPLKPARPFSGDSVASVIDRILARLSRPGRPPGLANKRQAP